jgi:predicted DNA-binding protein (MmcQ/YjbR family)
MLLNWGFMAVSASRVREMVAALDGTQESMHHGHPDFRVARKIFATLNEREDHAALRIGQIEARALAARSPSVFRLVSDREPASWVSILLSDVDPEEFEDLLEAAWSLRRGV